MARGGVVFSPGRVACLVRPRLTSRGWPCPSVGQCHLVRPNQLLLGDGSSTTGNGSSRRGAPGGASGGSVGYGVVVPPSSAQIRQIHPHPQAVWFSLFCIELSSPIDMPSATPHAPRVKLIGTITVEPSTPNGTCQPFTKLSKHSSVAA